MIRPTLPVAMSAAGANLLGAIVQYRVVAGWKKQGTLPCWCCFASTHADDDSAATEGCPMSGNGCCCVSWL